MCQKSGHVLFFWHCTEGVTSMNKWMTTKASGTVHSIQQHLRLCHRPYVQRASKSQLIIGSKEQRGILLVKTEVVQFEPLRKCETMVKFLSMADKVHTCFIKSYSILWLTSFFYRTVVGKKINPIPCASTIVAARFHLTTQNMNRKMTNGYTWQPSECWNRGRK